MNIMNTLTVSQKGKHCGEIRFHIKTESAEITPELFARAERELIAHPDHQNGYFDILLVDGNGAELDFETHIL